MFGLQPRLTFEQTEWDWIGNLCTRLANGSSHRRIHFLMPFPYNWESGVWWNDSRMQCSRKVEDLEDQLIIRAPFRSPRDKIICLFAVCSLLVDVDLTGNIIMHTFLSVLAILVPCMYWSRYHAAWTTLDATFRDILSNVPSFHINIVSLIQFWIAPMHQRMKICSFLSGVGKLGRFRNCKPARTLITAGASDYSGLYNLRWKFFEKKTNIRHKSNIYNRY
jgi:hypothetical protein